MPTELIVLTQPDARPHPIDTILPTRRLPTLLDTTVPKSDTKHT